MSGGGQEEEDQLAIFASDEEWAALEGALDGFELVDDDEGMEGLLDPSDEVVRVSRRIAGQYVEVLARFSASAFGRDGSAVSVDQVKSAIDALLRLARAATDEEQARLLEELLELVGPATQGRRNSRARSAAIRELRDWIPRFAATLEPADGDRLVRLVKWDRDAAPLLAELAEIHGIGPKRLGRLYAAGLFTVDSVAGSDPQDIVAVTGIPEKLAVAVVESTHAYALEERQRCLSGLVEQAHRLRRILKAVPMDDVVTAAAAALREVERTLHSLEDVE